MFKLTNLKNLIIKIKKYLYPVKHNNDKKGILTLNINAIKLYNTPNPTCKNIFLEIIINNFSG